MVEGQSANDSGRSVTVTWPNTAKRQKSPGETLKWIDAAWLDSAGGGLAGKPPAHATSEFELAADHVPLGLEKNGWSKLFHWSCPACHHE